MSEICPKFRVYYLASVSLSNFTLPWLAMNTGCLEDCLEMLHMLKTAVTIDNGIICIDSKSLQLCTQSKMQNVHGEE